MRVPTAIACAAALAIVVTASSIARGSSLGPATIGQVGGWKSAVAGQLDGWTPSTMSDSCFSCHGVELIYDWWLEIDWDPEPGPGEGGAGGWCLRCPGGTVDAG